MKLFWVALASLIILIPISFIQLFNKESTKQPIMATAPEEEIKQRDKIFQETLTQWVYSNSNRISLRTAREIVTESMATNRPLLMLSLICVESNFNPTAISKKGAMGLCQIMFGVHGNALTKAGIIKDKRELFDIGPNIKAGHFILDMYLKQNRGDVEGALERYLGGKDGVYLKKILIHLSNLYVLTRL